LAQGAITFRPCTSEMQCSLNWRERMPTNPIREPVGNDAPVAKRSSQGVGQRLSARANTLRNAESFKRMHFKVLLCDFGGASSLCAELRQILERSSHVSLDVI